MAILEIIQQGRYLKVTAIDEETGIEATIVADPNTPRHQLEQLAIQKLHYVMKKKGSS